MLGAVLAGCGGGARSARQRDAATAAPSSSRAANAPVAEPTTALFFGDSYIVGGGYTGPQSSMAAIAARRLGWPARIRGGGGTGFVSGNPDYGIPSFLVQIPDGALDVGPVDRLVIEGGGNDEDESPDLVTRGAVRVLKAAAKRHPEAQLVLVGTMDPTVDDFSDTDALIGALAAAASLMGVPYVDAQHWLEGRPELVGPDYDHPLPAGHRLCGRKLAKALRSLE